jgi:hypothetical protein
VHGRRAATDGAHSTLSNNKGAIQQDGTFFRLSEFVRQPLNHLHLLRLQRARRNRYNWNNMMSYLPSRFGTFTAYEGRRGSVQGEMAF